MNFWEFAHQHPVLIGFCVLFICLAAVDIAGHLSNRGKDDGEET